MKTSTELPLEKIWREEGLAAKRVELICDYVARGYEQRATFPAADEDTLAFHVDDHSFVVGIVDAKWRVSIADVQTARSKLEVSLGGVVLRGSDALRCQLVLMNVKPAHYDQFKHLFKSDRDIQLDSCGYNNNDSSCDFKYRFVRENARS